MQLPINKNCRRGQLPLRVCSTVLANRNARKYYHFVVLASCDVSFGCFCFVTCKDFPIDYVDTVLTLVYHSQCIPFAQQRA